MQRDPVRTSRFPLVFEMLVWVLYVGLYKYDQYMEHFTTTHGSNHPYFPYAQLILFALATTLYTVPYYRWLVPSLLRRRQYAGLAICSVLYLWWGIKLNTWLAAQLFKLVAMPPGLREFYQHYADPRLSQLWGLYQPHLALLFTDFLAFGCVAFVRVAFEQETRRHQLEHAHAALQLEQLKAQLQPHFLFNTLNSIYGLSLAGSPDTPRFILLLSELMRYVLYDSGKATIALSEEVGFLENYFEMEQRKYAEATIRFTATGPELVGLRVPPLLLLPLVENSFKHGRHHLTDAASVAATLTAAPGGRVQFIIENDMLPEPPPATPRRSGGIGLQNLRQRLALYYPGAHELHLTEHAGRYRAELTLQL